MLTVLVVRGATLRGALQGIKYFFTPSWKQLASPEVSTTLFFSRKQVHFSLLIVFLYYFIRCLFDLIFIFYLLLYLYCFCLFGAFTLLCGHRPAKYLSLKGSYRQTSFHRNRPAVRQKPWVIVFTALHGMQTRSSDQNSVCLSVCLSVRLSVCLSVKRDTL